MLDKTVSKVFGFDPISAEVGIEIEVEGQRPFPNIATYWNRERDGSLRGEYNSEYVLKIPLTSDRAHKALDELVKTFEAHKTEIDDSVRAGVHIHINVRGMKMRELWTFVTCYYVLEEVLTDFCGEGRSGNHFCLRALDADEVLERVGAAIGRDALNRLNTDEFRYLALNYNSLFKYGSLEFRAMRTPKNLSKIKDWVDILLTIKKNSKDFANPKEVVENFSLGGEEQFFRQMLGCYAKLVPMENHKLRRGVRLAQEIGYSVENW